jgi:hypothetical protein
MLGNLELQVMTLYKETPHVVCRRAPRTSTCLLGHAQRALLGKLELQVTTRLGTTLHVMIRHDSNPRTEARSKVS